MSGTRLARVQWAYCASALWVVVPVPLRALADPQRGDGDPMKWDPAGMWIVASRLWDRRRVDVSPGAESSLGSVRS
jgi:hypothetical protein